MGRPRTPTPSRALAQIATISCPSLGDGDEVTPIQLHNNAARKSNAPRSKLPQRLLKGVPHSRNIGAACTVELPREDWQMDMLLNRHIRACGSRCGGCCLLCDEAGETNKHPRPPQLAASSLPLQASPATAQRISRSKVLKRRPR